MLASPYAKKLAADAGISLAGVAGSGPHGRITSSDVEQLIASGGAKPAGAAGAGVPAGAWGGAGGEYVDLPVSQIKRVTAARLLESKQTIPHYYLTMECEVRGEGGFDAAIEIVLLLLTSRQSTQEYHNGIGCTCRGRHGWQRVGSWMLQLRSFARQRMSASPS